MNEKYQKYEKAFQMLKKYKIILESIIFVEIENSTQSYIEIQQIQKSLQTKNMKIHFIFLEVQSVFYPPKKRENHR